MPIVDTWGAVQFKKTNRIGYNQSYWVFNVFSFTHFTDNAVGFSAYSRTVIDASSLAFIFRSFYIAFTAELISAFKPLLFFAM